MMTRYDVVVIGAGVFGAWTAWHLARRGRRVLLADAYGPGNSRASSAGESRIIRMGYGADELYTRWSQRSLVQWKELFAAAGQPLFQETGVLWLAGKEDLRVRQTAEALRRCGVAYQELSRAELEKQYPQIGLDGIAMGLLEPHSGVLMARRAVAAVVDDLVRDGVEYRVAQITEPRGSGAISAVTTRSGERISADTFVFFCGAWLGKLFPEGLGSRIFPSRPEVVFFGGAAGRGTGSSTDRRWESMWRGRSWMRQRARGDFRWEARRRCKGERCFREDETKQRGNEVTKKSSTAFVLQTQRFEAQPGASSLAGFGVLPPEDQAHDKAESTGSKYEGAR